MGLSTYARRVPEEAGWGCSLQSVKDIHGHWYWYQSGKPICELHSPLCDAMPSDIPVTLSEKIAFSKTDT